MLNTPRAVVKALGGHKAAAQITRRTEQVAINWKRFKTLPASTYLEMTEALAELRPPLSAPPRLWNQRHYRPRKQRNGKTRHA
jgi:hypothetical protein